MQESLWFANQIIKPSNLDFMNDSTAKNVTDVVVAFTKGQPGVVAGLTVDPSLSINSAIATITAGFGFLANGERVQLFSASGVNTLPYSGTTSIYASLVEVNYNPDPSQNPLGSSNVASGLNTGSLDYQTVEQYNLLNLTTISGASFIKLADVTTNFGVIQSIDYTNRQNLKIGEIDLFANTINGSIITPSSIDSNQFVKPLHYSFTLNSGVNVDYLGSGVNHIASFANPIGNIFAISGTFHDLSGFSPILIDSMVQKSGTSLESNGTYVNIDTANKGTQIGGGMVVSGNSIDLTSIVNPANANLAITLNPAADININSKNVNIGATVNVGLGGINVVGGDINITNGGTLSVPFFNVNTLGINGAVSGNNTVFQGSVGISGNIISSGNLVFGYTEQEFTNIIPNGLMYPSGSAFSGTDIPNVWSGTNSYADFVVGPLNSPFTGKPYLVMPTGAGQLTSFLQGRNQYTVEMVFKSAANGFSRFMAINNTNNWRLESNNVSGHIKSVYLVGNTGAVILETPQNTWNANTWTHLAVSSSGSTTTIWIDGVAKVTNLSSVNNSFPASITAGTFATWAGDTTGADDLYLKAIKISNKAKAVFPSGLTNLYADSDTVALYDFNIVPSGVNRVPASGLGNLITATAPMLFYEAPSGTYTTGSAFLGQSFSGSTALDYLKDTLPVGSSNVFSGATNSPYFLKISGNNIFAGGPSVGGSAPSGISFSTPLNVIEGVPYNISYYTKLISGSTYPFFGADSNAIGVRAHAYSPNTNYSSVPVSGSILIGDWGRNSFDFTAPSGVGPLFLYLNFYGASGNTVSGTSLIGVSSVQATKGPAQLDTIITGPKIRTFSSSLLTPNAYVFSNVGGGTTATNMFNSQNQAPIYQVLSGAFISTGQFVNLQSSIKMTKNTQAMSAFWSLHRVTSSLKLDSVVLDYDVNAHQQAGINGMDSYGFKQNIFWQGYVPAGKHYITLETQLSGPDSSTYQYGVQGDNPVINLTLI